MIKSNEQIQVEIKILEDKIKELRQLILLNDIFNI